MYSDGEALSPCTRIFRYLRQIGANSDTRPAVQENYCLVHSPEKDCELVWSNHNTFEGSWGYKNLYFFYEVTIQSVNEYGAFD